MTDEITMASATPQQPSAPGIFETPTRNSARFVIESTTIAGLTGASLGSLLAAARGQSKPAYAFSMGANWVVVSAPFFAIREGVLHYRYAQNMKNGLDSFKFRDKDDLIASISSGAIVGAGLGFVWRGPRAIIAGSLMYAALACGGQAIYSLMHHYRIKSALQQRLQGPEQETATVDPHKWSLTGFWKMDIVKPDRGAPPAPAADFDPIGSLFKWTRDKINDSVDLPDWASPLMNAWDMEYRKKLNVRLDILTAHVAELEENITSLKRQLGETPQQQNIQ
ncbi:hypothetical protein BC832DRAFT_547115 [Gaertneriomyces semiglobifer]|nr:hypothetical protein BC832DRAFT_547115 [Gaertneriomyces semiglobifer]